MSSEPAKSDPLAGGDSLLGPQRPGLSGLLARTDSYGFVLILLVINIWVIFPFVSNQGIRGLAFLVMTCGVMLALHTSGVARGRILRTGCFLVLAISLWGGSTVRDDPYLAASAGVVIALITVGTSVVVLRRILSHEVITSRTVFGSIVVYLLVGIAFAELYGAVSIVQPHAFSGTTGDELGFSAMYFSFITLSTVGYGDISPATDVARALATFEAIAGQIYLVTLVARTVSLLGTGRGHALDPVPAPAPASTSTEPDAPSAS